jgi:transcriptional regulator GlxA family with amidase domain
MGMAEPRIRYAVWLMERHRAAPLPIGEIARAVNLSPAHLTRLFRRELGRSPARVCRDMRLAHARRLLQSSFLTVKQVMAACGWNDPSHFCREFKRQYGYSPTALRVSAPRPAAEAIDIVERRAAG